MLLNAFILAISSSIDSLGIGITYGIKNTKISYLGKLILFSISFLVSILSLLFGNIIKTIFPENFTKFLGSIILILMGIFICFQALKNESKKDSIKLESNTEKIYSFFIKFLGITIKIIKNPISSDLDNSKIIDAKESIFLGLALSLDSLCIGIGGSIIGINFIIFPFLISVFQVVFLGLGTLLGRKIYKLNQFPDNIWSIISGILLVFIGFLRYFL